MISIYLLNILSNSFACARGFSDNPGWVVCPNSPAISGRNNSQSRITCLMGEAEWRRHFFRSRAISRVGRSRKSARSANTSVIATIRPSVLLPWNPDVANTRKLSDNTAVVVHSAWPTIRKVIASWSRAGRGLSVQSAPCHRVAYHLLDSDALTWSGIR